MGLFDFFLPGRYEDAVLGTLTRSWGCWRGSIVLGADLTVPLVLAGWRSAPDPERLRLAQELVTRYEALRPAIEQALLDHYALYDEVVGASEAPVDADVVKIAHPDKIWPHVSPVRVLIERMAGRETVEIAYRATWDEEHTLGARFQAWELNGSVRA